jgi:hypothetical protein
MGSLDIAISPPRAADGFKDFPSVAALLARSGAHLITLRETGDHDA